MCRGAQAQIRNLFPVGGILSRSISGSCKVGDFVGFESLPAQFVDEYLVHGNHIFVRTDLEQTFLALQPKLGTFFVSQAVGRDVLYVQSEGFPYLLPPIVDRLAGQPVNKIDTDIVESRLLRSFYCLNSLFARMTSVYSLQCLVVEALYPDAEAIEWKRFDLL